MFNKTVKVVSGTKKFDGSGKMVTTGAYSRYGNGGAKNVKQRPGVDTTSIERPQIQIYMNSQKQE